MVSGQTVGIVGVGLGTVLIVFDFTQAGLGIMLLAIVGAMLAEIWSSGGSTEGRR